MKNFLINHKKLFVLFAILSILGLIDISSRLIIPEGYGLTNVDAGIISFLFGYITAIIFQNATLSGTVMTLFSFIFDFTIFWMIIAIYKYKKITQNKQQYERKK